MTYSYSNKFLWRQKSNKMGVKVIQLLLLMVHKLSWSKVFFFFLILSFPCSSSKWFITHFSTYIIFFVSFGNITKTRSSTSNIYYCLCTKEISAVKIDNYVSWHKEHFFLMNVKKIKCAFQKNNSKLEHTGYINNELLAKQGKNLK